MNASHSHQWHSANVAVAPAAAPLALAPSICSFTPPVLAGTSRHAGWEIAPSTGMKTIQAGISRGSSYRYSVSRSVHWGPGLLFTQVLGIGILGNSHAR